MTSPFQAARVLARRLLPGFAVRRLQRSAWYLRRHYCQRLASLDPAEEPDLEVVRALVQPGDLAVDVGANIGVYTRFLSQDVGPGGRVWSLEPVPFTYSVLVYNVRALGLSNVEPLPYAATEHDQPVPMVVPRVASGHLDIYLARIGQGDPASDQVRVVVPGRSLDSVWQERGGAPALVKIDVEGHEAATLRGARRMLERCRPALLIEIASDPDQAGSDAEAIFSSLAGLDYACFWWDGKTARRRRSGERHVNHFFLLPQHLARLRERGLDVEP